MKNKGFTLIELLVVIAIIALLASIIITNLSTTRNKAEVAKTQVQAREIKKAIELSWLNSESYPVQQEGLTMKEVVAAGGDNPLEVAIEEFYSGGIPDIPESVGGEDNDYYYISNGGKAIDSDGYKYVCGYNGKNTADDFVLFYKVKDFELYPDPEDLSNILFVISDTNVSPDFWEESDHYRFDAAPGQVAFMIEYGDPIYGTYLCIK